MTGLDVLGEPGNCHFSFIAHCRDGVIFHSHILCNDGCHGLHGKIFGMDYSAIAAFQTEGEINSKVSKENESQKENKIHNNV